MLRSCRLVYLFAILSFRRSPGSEKRTRISAGGASRLVYSDHGVWCDVKGGNDAGDLLRGRSSGACKGDSWVRKAAYVAGARMRKAAAMFCRSFVQLPVQPGYGPMTR